jgi:hypothetical protein
MEKKRNNFADLPGFRVFQHYSLFQTAVKYLQLLGQCLK